LPLFFGLRRKFLEGFMKYGYFKGKKVAECQDSQTSLMDRFKKQGIVDEWREAGTDPKEAARIEAEKAAAEKTEAERVAAEKEAARIEAERKASKAIKGGGNEGGNGGTGLYDKGADGGRGNK
jgi:hypothetical protein